MSRLIKSGWSNITPQENKVISIKRFKVEQEVQIETSQPVDISFEAEELLQKARNEAESIVAEANSYKTAVEEQLTEEKRQWEQEREALYQEAQQAGFEDGVHQGRTQGYEEVQGLISEAKQIVETSKEDYFKKIASSEQTILNIGLKVAERILGEHLLGEPEQFISIVNRALKEARDYREVQLHVNPIHYSFLVEQKDELCRIFPKETELYIYPDADLSEGSCIIESDNGKIDASVDQQLEVIKDKLFELLESE